MMPVSAAQMQPIGPGRLVVVSGPSGAGKDTLLRFARDLLGGDPNIVFPHRVVTREPSTEEDHEVFSEADFTAAVVAGDFAFWWDAHGLKYALGAAVDDDIRAGKTVVCNVSRAVISQLRRRYANVCVVLVTAPADILAARLAARGRITDGPVGARLARDAPPQRDLAPDVVIENVGDPRNGGKKLIAAIGA
ncbi:MAG TPA: phosphonate metabolism protein/1,5-bisphosphokinase (PRPP-forming) PhnN [Xanthobacteraceae bacterium]|nr:phosphonate metabolism protein/1,5-bisphosphokinase (PRPP-forming) PhnN [Xanthobacteraceae bacterium]